MTKYQHYKGEIYTLLSTSVYHTETNERLAVYENAEGKTFARPYAMFFGGVMVNGETVPRFKEIKPKKREYPTIKGKDAERFINRQENYMNNLLKKYGRNR